MDMDTPLGPSAPKIPGVARGPAADGQETPRAPVAVVHDTLEGSACTKAYPAQRLDHLEKYVYYHACITMGGEQVYKDFLKMRVETGDLHSKQQLEAVKFMNDIHLYVKSCLALLRSNGFPGIESVCDIVANQPRIPCTKCHYWTKCAITGQTVNKSLQISHDVAVHVGMSFEPFVYSFWLLSHIQAIELDRIHSYSSHYTGEMPVARYIENFKNSEFYCPADEMRIYEEAIGFVLNTMRLSL